jgi:hypothetical protein
VTTFHSEDSLKLLGHSVFYYCTTPPITQQHIGVTSAGQQTKRICCSRHHKERKCKSCLWQIPWNWAVSASDRLPFKNTTCPQWILSSTHHTVHTKSPRIMWQCYPAVSALVSSFSPLYLFWKDAISASLPHPPPRLPPLLTFEPTIFHEGQKDRIPLKAIPILYFLIPYSH